jgi:hypothetical protein
MPRRQQVKATLKLERQSTPEFSGCTDDADREGNGHDPDAGARTRTTVAISRRLASAAHVAGGAPRVALWVYTQIGSMSSVVDLGYLAAACPAKLERRHGAAGAVLCTVFCIEEIFFN